MHIGYFSDLEPLLIKAVAHDEWRLVQKLDKPFYFINHNGLIIAPVDCESSDLGSVPGIVQWVCDDDQYVPPFLIHDDMYFRRYALRAKFPYIPGDGNITELIVRYVFEPDEIRRLERARENFDIVRVDRLTADDTLNEAIYTYAPSETGLRRNLVYRAVRWFGWAPWTVKRSQRDVELAQVDMERNEQARSTAVRE